MTLDVLTWVIPGANAYGITVDPKGRVFLCGNQGVTRFDPATQTFDENFGAVVLGFNGCMTDGGDVIWVGGGGSLGTPGLHSYNADTLDFIQSYPVGNVKGVSVDYDGMIWGVGGILDADRAHRLDPTTGMVDTFIGLVGAYSYSDMTGFGLEAAGYIPIVPQ